MALRALLYFMIVSGIAGFLGVGWLAMQTPLPATTLAAAPPPPPPIVRPRVAILVAARQLHGGALLGPDDLASREIETASSDLDIDTADSRNALLGGMLRRSLPAGSPLHGDDVLRSKDRGFLAAVLAPGMRAVSVAVDSVSGAAGLIWPGDRVDLVLTQAIDNNTQPAGRRVSSETMLAGLRVIAIDQQLMEGMIGVEGTEHAVRTVTLEVSPDQAERVAVGARLGHLSLAVHPASADAPTTVATRPHGITWASDVSAAVTSATNGDVLRLYSGPEKTEEMHF